MVLKADKDALACCDVIPDMLVLNLLEEAGFELSGSEAQRAD